jgi:D-aminopeptidase
MPERNGVFISVDMEGVAGVVHLHQVMRGMPEYERSCRLMTAETNAAVAGARRAGATRFLVNDSHGDMRNFLLDELDDGVELISGADKPLSMGAGLDPSFEVAFFVGYHASVGTERAIMDHTYGGRTVYALRINGRGQSEATLNATLAGTFGLRTALITGDRRPSPRRRPPFQASKGLWSRRVWVVRPPAPFIRSKPAGVSKQAPTAPTRNATNVRSIGQRGRLVWKSIG